MINDTNIDLFELKVDALAHGYNTLGYMNAGLAREFKNRYPEMFREYKEWCKADLFKPGNIYFYKSLDKKPNVVNLGTQDNLKSAKLEYIEQALINVNEFYRIWDIKTLAMPEIGCGLGCLDWKDVDKIVRNVFNNSDLEIFISHYKS